MNRAAYKSMRWRQLSLGLTVALSAQLGCAMEGNTDPDCAGDKCDIFGTDDRLDWSEMPAGAMASGVGKTWRAIASDSVVALASLESTNKLLAGSPPLRTDVGICADAKFAQQPAVSFCTGILVADDLILTNRHCLETSLSDIRILFNYRMEGESALAPIEVREPVEVVDSGYRKGEQDYALIRLDRNAPPNQVPHTWIRWHDNAEDNELVNLISHPMGLPQKFTLGAVRSSADKRFEHTAATQAGSSGAPVFDDEGFLIGIHTWSPPGGGTENDLERDCLIEVINEQPTSSSNGAQHVTEVLDSYCSTASASPELCTG